MKVFVFIITLITLISGCAVQDNNVSGLSACELFDYEVDNCWCDDSTPENSYLYYGSSVENVAGAQEVVNDYLINEGLDENITSAVNISDNFYNVFTSGSNVDKVYTVSSNGTIIKTICGV